MLSIPSQHTAKSWALQSDGRYQRVQPKAGAPAFRSQYRFQELTREVVRVAEVAARPGSRFHMMPTAQRSPLEGKVPKTTRRRKNRPD